MAEEPGFSELLRRVRAGDESAAAVLVRQYESAVRRRIRLRLRDDRLRRLVDSVDICQSVLASFFVRAAAGQYDLQTPEQLLALLSTMARNKLISQARRPQVSRRGSAGDGACFDLIPDPGPSLSKQLEQRDLLAAVRRQLSEQELRLVELRQQDKEWAEIAQIVGGSAEALRKTLARALDRAAQFLGLDEAHDA